MAYRITKDECIACGACETVCPVSCITEEESEGEGKRVIDEKKCISCGSCADVCPVACIYEV